MAEVTNKIMFAISRVMTNEQENRIYIPDVKAVAHTLYESLLKQASLDLSENGEFKWVHSVNKSYKEIADKLTSVFREKGFDVYNGSEVLSVRLP